MYNHNLIEKKWQKQWLNKKIYQFKNTDKPKYYALDMFPYPSGSGLHLGHPKGYTATDIISRYKKLNGFDVLHPMGWDAFGLPAEQYAIDTNHHPDEFTKSNINHFREQLISLGFDYDYDKEVNTTDPKYYKWTQWIFTKLFSNNLAEIKDIEVNWCENLKTVLANEEVLDVNGQMVSERGNHPVIKKPMRQWVLKITKYADKLLDGLNEVDWPESLKSIQRKWIGRSKGTLVNFKTDVNINIQVFTTRVDTIYGATYIAIAPDNNSITSLTTKTQAQVVNKYIQAFKKKMTSSKNSNDDISGVFLGSYAINPLTNQKIPLYTANYVLNSYATGMVMGVPAHDGRDYKFAKLQALPIVYVINKKGENDRAYEGDGTHINSPLINGHNIEQSIKILNEYLIKNKLGSTQVSYKLKDWIFSRQRYWGEPFPIVFDSNNKPQLIEDLPVILPPVKDFNKRSSDGTPLSTLHEWVRIKIGGKEYTRDTNTMPQWAGSCWYYLGYLMKLTNGNYLDLDSKQAYELFKKWLPVDLYIGGQEHAVLHLLYARFWHRFLYDIKVVPTKEPFQKIINQGMILGTNGEKMSKSKGNTINPDEIIKTHGADALRLYEMFMGPLTASLPWNDSGLNGIRKWLDRVYRLFETIKIVDSSNEQIELAYHSFIKNVSQDIQNLSFNTAISQMMIFINECYQHQEINKKYLDNFVIVLSCFAPHLAEELWQSNLKHTDFIINSSWPTYDEKKLIKSFVIIPIQENGKLRDTIEVPIDIDEKELIKKVMELPKVIKFINNRKIKKTIYIKNKIINIII